VFINDILFLILVTINRLIQFISIMKLVNSKCYMRSELLQGITKFGK